MRKHSKYKNTYLIYEFLIRQLTNELIGGKKLQESNAYKIIKENFTDGILKKELTIYQALIDNKLNKKYSAEFLIEECIDRYRRLNKKKLNKVRYNLIKNIKESYNTDRLFSTEIEQYKEAGNVYFLFESIKSNDILNKSKYAGDIIDNILTPKEKNKSTQIFECIKKADPSDREMAFRIVVNTFNKKFSSTLNENQKRFIQDYVYNHTNESGYMKKHLSEIKKRINIYSRKLDKNLEPQQILKIKLDECVHSIDKLKSKKVYNESDYIKILQSYKLMEQLNEFTAII